MSAEKSGLSEICSAKQPEIPEKQPRCARQPPMQRSRSGRAVWAYEDGMSRPALVGRRDAHRFRGQCRPAGIRLSLAILRARRAAEWCHGARAETVGDKTRPVSGRTGCRQGNDMPKELAGLAGILGLVGLAVPIDGGGRLLTQVLSRQSGDADAPACRSTRTGAAVGRGRDRGAGGRDASGGRGGIWGRVGHVVPASSTSSSTSHASGGRGRLLVLVMTRGWNRTSIPEDPVTASAAASSRSPLGSWFATTAPPDGPGLSGATRRMRPSIVPTDQPVRRRDREP